MAQRLLAVVMRSPKELRLVADVLDKQERQDPWQANIIGAYLACVTLTKRYPTLVPSHARAHVTISFHGRFYGAKNF
jgi:hypothetical protein